jgi:hypothetical protein
MPTWPTHDKEKPIKNRWQSLPHKTALLPTGILARGIQKMNHFPVSKMDF